MLTEHIHIYLSINYFLKNNFDFETTRANSWLSYFLKDRKKKIKNRTQCVYLDGHCSITKQVTCIVQH